eukprot:scaffold21802_cov132-Isochrysis_galbana.AAC.7
MATPPRSSLGPNFHRHPTPPPFILGVSPQITRPCASVKRQSQEVKTTTDTARTTYACSSAQSCPKSASFARTQPACRTKVLLRAAAATVRWRSSAVATEAGAAPACRTSRPPLRPATPSQRRRPRPSSLRLPASPAEACLLAWPRPAPPDDGRQVVAPTAHGPPCGRRVRPLHSRSGASPTSREGSRGPPSTTCSPARASAQPRPSASTDAALAARPLGPAGRQRGRRSLHPPPALPPATRGSESRRARTSSLPCPIRRRHARSHVPVTRWARRPPPPRPPRCRPRAASGR